MGGTKENILIIIGIPEWPEGRYVNPNYKTKIADKIHQVFIQKFRIWDKLMISDRRKDFLMSFIFGKVYHEVIERGHRKELYKRFDLLDEDLLEEMVKKDSYIKELEAGIRQLYEIDYDAALTSLLIFKKEFSTPIWGLGFSYYETVEEGGRLWVYRSTRQGCAMISIGSIEFSSLTSKVDEGSKVKLASYIGLHEIGHIVFGEEHCGDESCVMREWCSGDVEEDLKEFERIERENPELFCSSHLEFLRNLKDRVRIGEFQGKSNKFMKCKVVCNR